MPVPRLILFTNAFGVEDDHIAQAVLNLDNAGYPPMVDALHGTHLDWIVRNYSGNIRLPHRFFDIITTGDPDPNKPKHQLVRREHVPDEYSFEESNDWVRPDLVIYYNDTDYISSTTWSDLRRFFSSIMFTPPDGIAQIDSGVYRRLLRVLTKLTTLTPLYSSFQTDDEILPLQTITPSER